MQSASESDFWKASASIFRIFYKCNHPLFTAFCTFRDNCSASVIHVLMNNAAGPSHPTCGQTWQIQSCQVKPRDQNQTGEEVRAKTGSVSTNWGLQVQSEIPWCIGINRTDTTGNISHSDAKYLICSAMNCGINQKLPFYCAPAKTKSRVNAK